MHNPTKRRLRWLAALAVAGVALGAVTYFSRGLRGPETVAGEFLSALMQTPQDPVALRVAGHLAEGDDPFALLEGMPTRIALDYLRARERLGVAHDIEVVERRRPEARRHSALLEVSERQGDAPARRFTVTLQQSDSGDWRVSAVSIAE